MRSKDFYKLPEGALLFNTIEQGTFVVKTQMTFWDSYHCYIDVKPIRGRRKSYVTSYLDLQRIPITEENLKMLGFKEIKKRSNCTTLGYRKLKLALFKGENSQSKEPNYIRILAGNNKHVSTIELDMKYVDELQAILRAIKMKHPKIFVNK